MKKLSMTLTLAGVLTGAVAQAEPVTVGTYATTGGATATVVEGTGAWMQMDLGEVTLPGAGSSVIYEISGLRFGSDYTVTLGVTATSPLSGMRLEILDPLSDGLDGHDMEPPAYVPTGYSTSNNLDGFSFAQDSGLARSAEFAGGSAAVTADENSHRGDILMFSGLNHAAGAINVTFGLRDRIGDRSFLLRLSGDGDMSPAPEPASMLLIGTGLAGLAAIRRRRQAAAGK